MLIKHSTYENSDLSGLDEATVSERKRLLKKTLGLLVKNQDSTFTDEEENIPDDEDEEIE